MIEKPLPSVSFDSVWEKRYANNSAYRNHYPWSTVVQFVFKNRPTSKTLLETQVLEVGCGNGANLWFAAREGMQVAGIDGSKTAIEYARDWFARDKLSGDFRVGDFAKLPFESRKFDLVIDRAALSFCGTDTVTRAIKEIHRVLKLGGRFMFTPYTDRCSSFDGLLDEDGCYHAISGGSIKPGAQVRFYGVNDVRSLFAEGWRILSLDINEITSVLTPARTVHSEWLVVAEKIAD